MEQQSRLFYFFDKINDWLAYFAGVIVICIMVSVTLDILSRELFNLPIKFLDELCGFSINFICFLGAAWVLKREGHVSVDILLDNLSPRKRNLFISLTSIFLAMLCLIFTYFGAKAAYDAYKRGLYIDIGIYFPIFPLMVVMPIGYILLSVQFLRRAYECMKTREAYKRPLDEEVQDGAI